MYQIEFEIQRIQAQSDILNFENAYKFTARFILFNFWRKSKGANLLNSIVAVCV